MRTSGCVLATLTLLSALPGCYASVGHNAVLQGFQVRDFIDTKIRGGLLAREPSLNVSKSTCPVLVVVLAKSPDTCLLHIDGQSYPLAIAFDSQTQQINATATQAIVSMTKTEQLVMMQPAYNRVARTLNCGKPRYRVLAPGTRFSCVFSGGPAAGKHIIVKVLNVDGQVFLFRNRSIPEVPEIATLNALLPAHKKGLPIFVDGNVVERVVFDEMGSAKELHLRSVHCPQRVNLTRDKAGYCVAEARGHRLRVRIWIDSLDNWYVRGVDYLFDFAQIQQNAMRYYRRLLFENGFMRSVRVSCPVTGLVVITPPATKKCWMDAGDGRVDLYIAFDENGQYRYDVPEP